MTDLLQHLLAGGEVHAHGIGTIRYRASRIERRSALINEDAPEEDAQHTWVSGENIALGQLLRAMDTTPAPE